MLQSALIAASTAGELCFQLVNMMVTESQVALASEAFIL